MANMNLVTGYWGEEHVTSNDQGSFNAATLGSGEFVTERGNQFAASIISNNKIRVLDGDLMMQGRHIRIDEETYVDLYFDNGTQGYKRNDLIVARYTKDSATDKEACTLAVIKGTPVEDSPVDPDYITGDILTEHALQNDMPLFRVPFDGLNIQPLVPLFKTASSLNDQINHVDARVSTLGNTLTNTASSLNDQINHVDARVSTLGNTLTNTSRVINDYIIEVERIAVSNSNDIAELKTWKLYYEGRNLPNMGIGQEYTIFGANDTIKNATDVKLILSPGGTLDLTIPNEFENKTYKGASTHYLSARARRLSVDGSITLVFDEIAGWNPESMVARIYYR